MLLGQRSFAGAAVLFLCVIGLIVLQYSAQLSRVFKNDRLDKIEQLLQQHDVLLDELQNIKLEKQSVELDELNWQVFRVCVPATYSVLTQIVADS
jgi:hypothetical protein